jgi:hypothetical protein
MSAFGTKSVLGEDSPVSVTPSSSDEMIHTNSPTMSD